MTYTYSPCFDVCMSKLGVFFYLYFTKPMNVCFNVLNHMFLGAITIS